MSGLLTLSGCTRYRNQNFTAGTQGWELRKPADLTQVLDGTFYTATPAEVAQIIEALQTDGLLALQRTSLKMRADLVRAWCALYEKHKPQLVARASSENARSLGWYDAESGRMLSQARAMADFVESGDWQRLAIVTYGGTPVTPDIRSMDVSFGVCGLWGPNNFIKAFGAASGSNTIAAALTGNPLLCVAGRNTAGTDELLFRLLELAAEETQFPLAALALVQCGDLELAKQIVRGVNIVGFTGGLTFGRLLEQEALANDTEVRMELSGPNGLYMMPSTFNDSGWEGALDAAFCAMRDKGDFCTHYGYMFTDEEHVEQVVGRLVPQANASGLVQMLSLQGAEGYARRVDEFRKAGVEWVGQTKDDPKLTERATGKVMIGRMNGDEFLKAYKKHNFVDHPFGSATVVVGVSDIEQFARISREMKGSLVSTIWSTSDDDFTQHADLIYQIERYSGRRQRGRGKVGQGVRVCASQRHVGMRPAASSAAFTSVNPRDAIYQFLWQAAVETEFDGMRPELLKDGHTGDTRLIDGTVTKDAVPAKSAT